MNPFLLRLLSICGIMLAGNGFPNPFSTDEDRDEYQKGYYLRKIPKVKTSPHRVIDIVLNPLTWLPAEESEEDQNEEEETDESEDEPDPEPQPSSELKEEPPRRKYLVNVLLETEHRIQKPDIFGVRENLKRVKNFTARHNIPTNWTELKFQTRKGLQEVQNYVERKHLKEVLRNFTHPLRYRGSRKQWEQRGYSRCLGPSVRIHPKSSHVEVIRTTTTEWGPLEMSPSAPRKFKVTIDLNSPVKQEGNIKVHDKYLTGVKPEANCTAVRDTSGMVATDLAGRVTRVWHCVLGNRHLPDIKDIKFYLYTRRNVIQPELLRVNYDLIGRKIRANPQYKDVDCVDIPPENIGRFERVSDENRRIIRSNFLNIRAPTKILIHGYTGSYKDSRMTKIKDAYLNNGRYNVIQVDWEILAAPPCYIRVTQHSKFVGETIAKFLDGLYLIGLNMSLVHIVGFSLGAQVAGFVGNNATITPVCRITGLDPALPLFLHTQPSGHLDRLDAKFVDVIHTCGGILAMLDPLGHVDFYPNGGTRQPGCEFSNLKCSHSRAPQYFAESVTSQKKFKGRLCLNWEEFVSGNCDNNTDISFMGEPCSRRSVPGKYYLLTKSKEPFVL